jgi:hypothetical protein
LRAVPGRMSVYGSARSETAFPSLRVLRILLVEDVDGADSGASRTSSAGSRPARLVSRRGIDDNRYGAASIPPCFSRALLKKSAFQCVLNQRIYCVFCPSQRAAIV